ncbi:hypothetical protein FHETE_3952 [Fusarium heterosporum]|uniref:Uncharacterized protein n=1 Tax=Fusarium heterosporum TaxID=42747 RepID=A0A8H5TGF5_FUSHE|nr:hypothetical protein FHETE_3952 [Fusarium heterosporum]
MRGFIPLLLTLSVSYTTITALPQPRIVLREAAAEPQYSVVPLEPGEDDPASGETGSGDGNDSNGNGSGGGSNGNNGHGTVTVIQTVTRKPVTQVVTRTEEPGTVTAPGKTVTKAIPTTVSVIDIDGGPVTETVTVPRPTSKTKRPKKSTTTNKADITTTTTIDEKPETTVQSTSESFSSADAPGVTSQPKPKPQPQPQPIPEPESSTTTEPAPAETSSATRYTETLPPVETVTQPSAIEPSVAGPDPTTLLTLTTQGTELPEETALPSPDSPVAPIPPQETFVHDTATQGESWSTATVPYVPPVAPTTLVTSIAVATTTCFEDGTPETISPSETHDDGAWHTSYPAWNGTVRAI